MGFHEKIVASDTFQIQEANTIKYVSSVITTNINNNSKIDP